MNRLKKWRESHLLLADAILAILVGSAVLAILLWHSPSSDAFGLLDGARALAYSSIAAICGSMLGFIITAVSIISVFGSLPRLRLLASSRQFQQIFRIYFHAIYWLAGATMLALLGLVIDSDKTPVRVLTVVAVLVFAVTVARIWRCIWILQKLVTLSSKPIPNSQPSVPQSESPD